MAEHLPGEHRRGLPAPAGEPRRRDVADRRLFGRGWPERRPPCGARPGGASV